MSVVSKSVKEYKRRRYLKDFGRISKGKKRDSNFKRYSLEYIEELADYFDSIGDYDKSQLLLMVKI